MEQKPIKPLENNKIEVVQSFNGYFSDIDNLEEAEPEFFIGPDGKSFRTELAMRSHYARNITQEVIDEYGKEEFQKFLSRFSKSSLLHGDNSDSFFK